jgi:hypothetical protein
MTGTASFQTYTSESRSRVLESLSEAVMSDPGPLDSDHILQHHRLDLINGVGCSCSCSMDPSMCDRNKSGR